MDAASYLVYILKVFKVILCRSETFCTVGWEVIRHAHDLLNTQLPLYYERLGFRFDQKL